MANAAVKTHHQRVYVIVDFFTSTSGKSAKICLHNNSVWHMLSSMCCFKRAHLQQTHAERTSSAFDYIKFRRPFAWQFPCNNFADFLYVVRVKILRLSSVIFLTATSAIETCFFGFKLRSFSSNLLASSSFLQHMVYPLRLARWRGCIPWIPRL